MEIITAGLPVKDNCTLFARTKAFLVDQNVLCQIQHQFRNRDGQLISLEKYQSSLSDSVSSSSTGGYSVVARFSEWLGTGMGSKSDYVELEGTFGEELGSVLIELTEEALSEAGIFEMHLGIKNANGSYVLMDRALLSVERSLFATDDNLQPNGPPTIREIRAMIMDSDVGENSLIDALEFSDDQIMQALTEPIRMWNETPPPIETFNTRNFPFRGAWMCGVKAALHAMGAHHYRRNFLQTAGGGVQVADKAKEKEYNAESDKLWAQYKEWLMRKKAEINMKKMMGYSLSTYYPMSFGGSVLGW